MLSRTLVALATLVLMSPPLLAAPQSASRPDSAKPLVIVNLNTATVAELETLPGIGVKTAARIVEHRDKKGPFKKIQENLERPRSSTHSAAQLDAHLAEL